MIIGIGHDLVDIRRIDKLLQARYSDMFMRRVLTEAEYNYAKTKEGRLSEFIAGRFSVKEAVVKALGCGIGRKVGFQDVEVLPDANGKPCCTIAPEAYQRLGLDAKTIRVHVSITHTSAVASTYAIAEQI
jgi:holo-[acyl-carrier protein] synthase